MACNATFATFLQTQRRLKCACRQPVTTSQKWLCSSRVRLNRHTAGPKMKSSPYEQWMSDAGQLKTPFSKICSNPKTRSMTTTFLRVVLEFLNRVVKLSYSALTAVFMLEWKLVNACWNWNSLIYFGETGKRPTGNFPSVTFGGPRQTTLWGILFEFI